MLVSIRNLREDKKEIKLLDFDEIVVSFGCSVVVDADQTKLERLLNTEYLETKIVVKSSTWTKTFQLEKETPRLFGEGLNAITEVL